MIFVILLQNKTRLITLLNNIYIIFKMPLQFSLYMRVRSDLPVLLINVNEEFFVLIWCEHEHEYMTTHEYSPTPNFLAYKEPGFSK